MTTNNIPATDNANVANIVAILSERNDIRNKIELPTIEAIRTQAAKFNGKVFNRRFTAAVTKALESNGYWINVGFSEKYDGSTEYDIIRVYYNYNGKHSEFRLYPDRSTVSEYTDENGRLVAEKLLKTCDYYEAAARENIQEDENAIARAAEFVARVEAVRAEIEAINKDFPLSLRARFTGNVNFCK